MPTAAPSASSAARIEENLRAADLRLSPAQLEPIDQAVPPPSSKRPLEMV